MNEKIAEARRHLDHLIETIGEKTREMNEMKDDVTGLEKTIEENKRVIRGLNEENEELRHLTQHIGNQITNFGVVIDGIQRNRESLAKEIVALTEQDHTLAAEEQVTAEFPIVCSPVSTPTTEACEECSRSVPFGDLIEFRLVVDGDATDSMVCESCLFGFLQKHGVV